MKKIMSATMTTQSPLIKSMQNAQSVPVNAAGSLVLPSGALPMITSTGLVRPADAMVTPPVVPRENNPLSPRSRMRRRPLAQVNQLLANNLNREGNNRDINNTDDGLEELRSYFYSPISTIAVEGTPGGSGIGARYIKAYNPLGQIVYISMDGAGRVMVTQADLTHITSNPARIVPLQMRRNALDSAGNGVSGVAFECGADGICTVVRDSDLKERETYFVYAEKRSEKSGVTSDLAGYPIVSLSDIRANQAAVLEFTKTATANMRNVVYSACSDVSKQQALAIERLREAGANFDRTREEISSNFKRTLDKLNEYRLQYLANPGLYGRSDVEIAKYRKVHELQKQANEVFPLLPSSCQKSFEVTGKIVEAANTLNSLTINLREQFAFVFASL